MESIDQLEKKIMGFEDTANESFNKHKYELALPLYFEALINLRKIGELKNEKNKGRINLKDFNSSIDIMIRIIDSYFSTVYQLERVAVSLKEDYEISLGTKNEIKKKEELVKLNSILMKYNEDSLNGFFDEN